MIINGKKGHSQDVSYRSEKDCFVMIWSKCENYREAINVIAGILGQQS